MNYCYILWNRVNNRTYNGYTVDLKRRLRQHNGEIKGGAKFTTRCVGVNWEFLAIVSVFDEIAFDKRKALSCEWHIRYPDNKRPRSKKYNGARGRLTGLFDALANPKFSELKDIQVWIADSFYEEIYAEYNGNDDERLRLLRMVCPEEISRIAKEASDSAHPPRDLDDPARESGRGDQERRVCT
jgi:predicted GIY-YIG superfamily endonuclease